MYRKYFKYLFALFFMGSTLPAFAEKGGMPGYVFYGLVGGYLIIGLVISRFISLLLKSILEGLIKKPPKHDWFMTLGTFVFPTSFLYIQDTYQVLYYIHFMDKQTAFWTILILLIIIGFLLGYFITPKKTTPN